MILKTLPITVFCSRQCLQRLSEQSIYIFANNICLENFVNQNMRNKSTFVDVGFWILFLCELLFGRIIGITNGS